MEQDTWRTQNPLLKGVSVQVAPPPPIWSCHTTVVCVLYRRVMGVQIRSGTTNLPVPSEGREFRKLEETSATLVSGSMPHKH